VTVYGMNKKVGNISFNDTQENQFNKPYSEKTAELIDEEVRLLISDSYDRTKRLLLSKQAGLIALAEKLLEKEILFQSDLEEILGKRPFEHRTTYDEFVNSGNDEKKEEDADKDTGASSLEEPKATPTSTNAGLPDTDTIDKEKIKDNLVHDGVEDKSDTFEPKE